uniref:Uncharacterized protein n=1 Tax=Nonomuraea gerenzanensis TaxID=93944 RepID=A0A1M4DVM5_9ACTN|nr:hypothetical protein BN4615_P109 [Nonomuraea gerenzanensis]
MNRLADDPGPTNYISLGRFMAHEDADTWGSYDLWLHVGYVRGKDWESKELVS